MTKRLIKNRKGTAEVIGTIMFIVILLFFFTNVYLWHDAATKDANQLYLKQINSTFKITQTGPSTVQITAGGSDILLSRLWITDANGNHLYTDLNNMSVKAGQTTPSIDLSTYSYNSFDQTGKPVNAAYSSPAKCSIINTLGIVESTTFQ